MKSLKIFALLACVVGLASCSESEKVEYNTASGVTVGMEYSEISFMESKGIVNVPVKVTGEANGYITVTCKVAETGSNVAMADVHYLLTSSTINIADDSNVGNFEIRLVDDREINDDRTFIITLVDAQGASLSGIESTVVTIADNDNKPYDRLAGEWYVPCKLPDGSEQMQLVTINAYDESEYGYGYSYMVTGLLYGTDFPIQMMFHYDEATKEGDLTIRTPQTVTTGEDTGDLYLIDDALTTPMEGNVTLTWNEDVTELYVISSPISSSYANFIVLDSQWYTLAYIFDVNTFYRERP